MELILKQVNTVKSYEVDFTGKMKLYALFYLLQEAAYNHAVILKVGFRDLLEQKKFWVLSRMKIRIYRYPLWDDQIEIHTWPKSIEKAFSSRDFMVYDTNKQPVVAATSLWMILDLETKQVQRLNSLKQTIPVYAEQQAIAEVPGKIDMVNGIENYISQKVLYNDIDVNKHVNNAKYVEWLLNSFSIDFYNHHEIGCLQINFLSEAVCQDTLLIGKSRDEDNKCLAEGVSENTGHPVFRAMVEWREKTL